MTTRWSANRSQVDAVDKNSLFVIREANICDTTLVAIGILTIELYVDMETELFRICRQYIGSWGNLAWLSRAADSNTDN